MLASVSRKMAIFLAGHGIIEPEYLEIYAYSIEMLLASSIIWLCLGTIAAINGAWIVSIFYFAGFYLMRSVAGGYHASDHLRCTILTVISYSAFIWLIGVWPMQLDKPLIHILIFVAVICIWCYAPMDSVNKPFTTAERQNYQRKSRIMVTFLAIMMMLGLLVALERLTLCLALGTAQAAVSVTVAYYLERRSKHDAKSII